MTTAGLAVDLTKIARDVATTREGRRNHKKAAKNLEAKKADPCSNKLVCFFFFCNDYLLLFALIICVYYANSCASCLHVTAAWIQELGPGWD